MGVVGLSWEKNKNLVASVENEGYTFVGWRQRNAKRVKKGMLARLGCTIGVSGGESRFLVSVSRFLFFFWRLCCYG